MKISSFKVADPHGEPIPALASAAESRPSPPRVTGTSTEAGRPPASVILVRVHGGSHQLSVIQHHADRHGIPDDIQHR
jgi:hypothetical protein